MLKLLIVDDSQLIRKCLKQWFIAMPEVSTLTTAASLFEARALMVSLQPHLMLLDLRLPDGNALHELSALKRASPHTSIAVLTSDSSNFSRQQCQQAGATWFFDKSTEFESMVKTLTTWVDQAASADNEGVAP